MFKRFLSKQCLMGAASLWLLGGCITSAQWTDFGRSSLALLAADLVRSLASGTTG